MRPGLLAACLLAVACSKSRGASDGGAATSSFAGVDGGFAHPCALLQRADAESVLGATDLHEDERPGPPGDARCAWAVNGGRGLVELYIQLPSRKDDFDHSNQEREQVPGVGDRAYIQKRRAIGHVDVLKGEQTFYVQLIPPDRGGTQSPATVAAQAIALAKTIASRM
jgi:hypothetical protein